MKKGLGKVVHTVQASIGLDGYRCVLRTLLSPDTALKLVSVKDLTEDISPMPLYSARLPDGRYELDLATALGRAVARLLHRDAQHLSRRLSSRLPTPRTLSHICAI